MSDDAQTLSALLELWLGGALMSLFGAALGRLMYHVGEARKGNRRFISWDLLWELPICFGMAVIGEDVVGYLDVPSPTSTAIIAGLAYLGPRGVEVALMSWLNRKAK